MRRWRSLRVLEASATLRVALNSALEARSIAAALSADDEALEAFDFLCRYEGIVPALESAHAVAYAMGRAKAEAEDKIILVNLSGRGDKDVHTVREARALRGEIDV